MPLLPYATVKPHDPSRCQPCTREGIGHYVCQNPACPGRGENSGVGRVAEHAERRYATEAEYAALPPAHQPIDGIAHKAVYACDECTEDVEPFCEHPEPAPQPCPVCKVTTGPCFKRDGVTPRHVRHAARTDPQPGTCTHVHRADCGIFTDCSCTADDEPPVRPKRPRGDGHRPDLSRLGIPETAARMLLAQRGIAWWQVREAASVLTQDTRPALQAEYAALDEAGHVRRDDDGHEVRETILIELDVTAQR